MDSTCLKHIKLAAAVIFADFATTESMCKLRLA